MVAKFYINFYLDSYPLLWYFYPRDESENKEVNRKRRRDDNEPNDRRPENNNRNLSAHESCTDHPGAREIKRPEFLFDVRCAVAEGTRRNKTFYDR